MGVVDSFCQFCFGPVTNKELEEEVAHDHVCMLCKTVLLQSSELSVVY